MSDQAMRAIAKAHLDKAGLSMSEEEFEQVLSFYDAEGIDSLYQVAGVRYEVPALRFDPLQELAAWPEASQD